MADAYKVLALLAVLLLLASPAQAVGTLLAGSKVQVTDSPVTAIDGKVIMGTWVTSPTANDQIKVTSASIDDYDLKADIIVDVMEPQFKQVVGVQNQKRLTYGTYYTKAYAYFSTSASSAQEKCLAAHDAYMKGAYPNGFEYMKDDTSNVLGLRGKVDLFLCSVEWVLQESQVGWLGQVSTDSWVFRQEVKFGSKGTVVLQETREKTELSGSVGGIAYARLLSFGQWFNAELDTDDIYAFHSQPTASAGNWQPFQGVAAIRTYEDSLSQLRVLWNSDTTKLTSTELTAVKAKLDNLKSGALDIKGASTAPIDSWTEKIEAPITYSENKIIVPLRTDRPIFISNIQLIMSGEDFGLIFNYGVPEIVSVGSARFSDASSGSVDYVVKNAGKAQGSFVLSADCGSKVAAQKEWFTLGAGLTRKGSLYLEGKGTAAAVEEKLSCTLTLTETATSTTDKAPFFTTLIRKPECTQGEQTAPRVEGANWIVEVKDSTCRVIQTKQCPVETKHFVKDSAGVYQCVALAGGEGETKPEGGGDADDGGKPSVPLLVATLILSLGVPAYLALVTAPYMKGLRLLPKQLRLPVRIVRLAVLFGIGIALFILVPTFIKGTVELVTNLFTFGG